MTIWTARVAVAIWGAWLIAPGMADSGSLFDPPPIPAANKARRALTGLEAAASGGAAIRDEAPRRRSVNRIREVRFASGEAGAEEGEGSPAGDETPPLPPGWLPGGRQRAASDSAVPGRLPVVPNPASTDARAPAPLMNDAADPSADDEPASPFQEEPSDSVADEQVPAPRNRSTDSATEGEPPRLLPHDPAYPVIKERPGEKTDLAECPWDCSDEGCCGSLTRGGVCCREGGCSGRCGQCRLFDLASLRRCDVEVGGWLEQGITVNGHAAADRFNGPVTFNDRSGEYQMNQLYLFAERVARTCGYGADLGGRVDLVYGTDRRFTVSDGLDDDWSDTERFYGLSMPQLYLDVAYNDLLVRMGHFYTIIGYETVTAPDNFFYSHAYAMQYGEPFTHTGVLGIYDVGDCWRLSAGFHRGWDQWEDNNDQLGFLGGVTWTSADQGTSAAFALTTSSEDDAGDKNRLMYSFVFTRRIACRLRYVFQQDLGYEDDAGPRGQDAEWYGINNYLYYELNRCWSVGLRYEWFNDDDGTRVRGANGAGGIPNGIELEGVPAHWHELTIGLNWRPNENIFLRTECRWDWVTPHDPAAQGGPFNDLVDRHQFLWGTDLVVEF